MKIFIEFIKKHPVLIAFSVAVIITILRRPDIVLNAQFWAEDGKIWFSQMHNDGIVTLLSPRNGYFQSISRIAAFFATGVPLDFAPLIMNSFFIIVKAAPVTLLWSGRLDHIVHDWRAKILLSIWYLLMPNVTEVHGNVTNAHWYLGFYALLIVFATQARTVWWRIHDVIFIMLAGLSGPFILFVAPAAFILWWISGRSYTSWRFVILVLIGITSIIQSGAIFIDFKNIDRSVAALGASVPLFMKIISAKLVGPIFFSHKGVNDIWKHTYYYIPLFFFFGSIIYYGLRYGTIYIRLAILYAVLLLSAALISPQITNDPTSEQWHLMKSWMTGSRYFVVPMTIFIGVLFWSWSNIKIKFFKNLLVVVMIITIYGMIIDFHIKPLKNLQWKEQVDKFYEVPVGEVYSIPINPKGWYCKLER